MKNKILIIISSIIVAIFIIVFIYTHLQDSKQIEQIKMDASDLSKEEYVYKDDLLELGYSIDEIKTIENKISNVDVKNYLLIKRYPNLTLFTSSPYFKIENIERYENYYESNNYSADETVLYVEIGLDKEAFTDAIEIDNYTSITAIVNKYNRLPEDAEFNDLIEIPSEYRDKTNRKVRIVIYDDLIKMFKDAAEDGITLRVVSGFRTWSQQSSLFNNNKNKNGLEHALMYSAKPGYSEHQLGLAVDLNSVYTSFANTKEYEWLKQNSYKYGFIERYPKGKEFITGYAYEPWHYRYLGEDIATKLYEENITYEEYLVKHAK